MSKLVSHLLLLSYKATRTHKMSRVKVNVLKKQADMDDKESLRKALKGAYAVFSVTNFWEILDGAREKQQGINVADVAKEEGVQLFVWSNVIHAKKGLYIHSSVHS